MVKRVDDFAFALLLQKLLLERLEDVKAAALADMGRRQVERIVIENQRLQRVLQMAQGKRKSLNAVRRHVEAD